MNNRLELWSGAYYWKACITVAVFFSISRFFNWLAMNKTLLDPEHKESLKVYSHSHTIEYIHILIS